MNTQVNSYKNPQKHTKNYKSSSPYIKSHKHKTSTHLFYLVQKLDECLFCCTEGHPHQIVDGTPLDPLHLCSATVPSTIKLFLDTEATNRVTWSCGGCKRSYRSTTTECKQTDCQGLTSRMKSEVVKRTLEAIRQDILRQVLPYDQSAVGLDETPVLQEVIQSTQNLYASVTKHPLPPLL